MPLLARVVVLSRALRHVLKLPEAGVVNGVMSGHVGPCVGMRTILNDINGLEEG